MNVFLDTNIFLGFYHFSNDDLQELEKLDAIMNRGDLTVLLPQHVRVEFERNREHRLADALQKMKELRVKHSYPQVCRSYQEYGELREIKNQLDQTLTELIERVEADVTRNELAADQAVSRLMNNSQQLECDDQVLQRAKDRVALGNPPGKKGSLGDAVIWESLKEHAPNDDIQFISDDRDYQSTLDSTLIKDVLMQEWVEEKGGAVDYYRSLSAFLRRHFPDIDLASEREKSSAIHALATCPSFADTHQVVRRLRQFADFSDSQAISIIDASFMNDQVRMICGDGDVAALIESIIEGRERWSRIVLSANFV